MKKLLMRQLFLDLTSKKKEIDQEFSSYEWGALGLANHPITLEAKPRLDAITEQMKAQYRQEFPRRKDRDDPAFSALCELYPDLYAAWKKERDLFNDKLVTRFNEVQAEKQAIDQEVFKIESHVEIVISPDDPWQEWRRHSGHTYSTQGYGAKKYAEVLAKIDVEEAKFFGLEAKYEHKTGVFDEFLVSIKCSAETLQLIEYKKGLPLQERVRLCWLYGANPRVYMPFLPWGFEEKFGFDHFGRKKEAQNG